MNDQQLVALTGNLAWPLTGIILGALFYRPLSNLLETLSRRITKLSLLKVDIELGRLSQGQSLIVAVEGLKDAAVTQSYRVEIVTGVINTGSADYVVVEIGEGNRWITSRLFLLSAILERSRAVRCLVFLSNKRFIGAATPRDVRASLGARFLAYESALAAAYGELAGADQNSFRGGLSETLVNRLTNSFLTNRRVVDEGQPASTIGWIEFARDPPKPRTWEFADWITVTGLREILGRHLMADAVSVSAGTATPEATKSIIASRGMFVALIDTAGLFVGLCDRYAVLESVGRQAME